MVKRPVSRPVAAVRDGARRAWGDRLGPWPARHRRCTRRARGADAARSREGSVYPEEDEPWLKDEQGMKPWGQTRMALS